MPELEELKLVVSLTDNASPQLVQLRRQLEDLGGGPQAGNLHRVSRETRELNEQVKELIKSIGEGPKALAEFARGAGTFGLVVGSFALIADKAARALRDYSSEVVKMSQAADMAGISTAQYHKNLEALQRSGLGSMGPQLIQQMSKAFDDFKRQNSEGVQRLREMTFAQPELGAIINRQIEQLRSATSPEEIVKRAKETADAVADYYRRRGATKETIAEQRDETYRRMGFDPRIQFAEEMAKTTHEEEELWEKRRQTTLNYYRDSTRIIQAFNEAIRNIDINTMDRLSGIVAGIADSMEKIAHASKDIKADWIDILAQMNLGLSTWNKLGQPTEAGPKPGTPEYERERGETSPAEPPLRGGGGGGGAWLMSPTGGGSLLMPGELPHDPGRRLSSDEYLSHIIAGTRDVPTEDRRGEVFAAAGGTRERVTLLNANTAELRKLNDYLSGTTKATGAYGFLSGGAGGGGGALAGAVATRMGGLAPGLGRETGRISAAPMGPLPSMPRVGPAPSGPGPSGPAPSGPAPSGPGPSGPGPSGPYGVRGGPSVMPGAAPIRPTGGGFQPGPAGSPQPDSGATGSAYLAEQRAHLFEELDRDPAAKKFVSQVLEHENEGSPEAYAAVLEAWVNRANFSGHRSLRQGANFFGPVQRGELREVSPAKQRQIDEAIRMVRGGSNLIEGRTDQGMIHEHPYARQVGEAGARLRRIHGEYFSDWGPEAAEFSRRQQARVRGEGPRSAPSNLEMLRVRPGEAGDVSGLLGGQTRLPATAPIAAMAGAPIAAGAVPAVGGGGPQAFIMHHTSGRGTVEGVKSTLQGRRLGVQYIMDREGNITQYSGPGAAHMLPGWGLGAGLRNANVVGMEVIAKNDADVTPAQVAAAVAFMERNYPNTPIFGHGQVNPGHKEADEGMTIKNAIELSRSQRIAAPVTTLKTRTVDFNLDRDVLDLAMSKDIKQVKGTADVNVKVGGGAKDEEERERPPYKKTDVEVPSQAEKARSGDTPKKGGQTAEDHDPSLDS